MPLSGVQVPNTIAMMRQEMSSLKEHFQSRPTTTRSKSKLPAGQQQVQQQGKNNLLMIRKHLTPSGVEISMVKENEAAAIREWQKEQTDLNRKKRLWRSFRQRMRLERREALQSERDAQLSFLEQKKEWTGELEGGMCRYEVELPRTFMSSRSSTSSSRDDNSSMGGGGFWDFMNIFHGGSRSGNKSHGSTASTSEVTSLASDYTTESESSRYTWQSTQTAKMGNCSGTRDMLVQHFGGEHDNPWLAAKRGDLAALEGRWKNRNDWTLEDEHGNPPLYYACSYGGARNIRVVFFCLQQWPKTQHIPEALLARCKADAANIRVQEILINPSQAEWIIHDYEENCSHNACNDLEDDDESEDYANRMRHQYYSRGPLLHGIREEDES